MILPSSVVKVSYPRYLSNFFFVRTNAANRAKNDAITVDVPTGWFSRTLALTPQALKKWDFTNVITKKNAKSWMKYLVRAEIFDGHMPDTH
jgi:hypothetical protein